MSYLDQITVGSTTYDIQDSNAQRKMLEGAGAPTTSTVGTIGQHYYNTSATAPPFEYICTAISGSTYTWMPFGMSILSYGHSTWAEFLAAYNAHEIVYCRASSGTNPGSGAQTRLAFMAYVNADPPTSVEFQYYRSVATHSDSQQGDQVFVYKLNSSGTWSYETRNTFTKVAAGTGLSHTWSNGTITITNAQTPLPTVSSSDNGKILQVAEGAWAAGEMDALPTVSSADNGKILGVTNGSWAVTNFALPSGGTQGQFLVKQSSTDYDVAWTTVANASGVNF